MNRLTIQTSSRLHFGLLSWGGDAPREFGGLGLMIDDPGLILAAEPTRGDWEATGPLSTRVLAVARRVGERIGRQGRTAPLLRFEVIQAPPEHVGLGVGTQTALAVARLIAEDTGLGELPALELAQLAGRGLRSGIGLHGFAQGGLIVDGGRSRAPGSPPAPLLARLEFPADWSILVLIPPDLTGLHGPAEIQAFGAIPPLPASTVDRLCRLVLLDLLPAVAERDLATFGAALSEIQTRIGEGFAPAQGGIFAHPNLETLAHDLRALGLVGVGQSSWGPTLYGFADAATIDHAALRARIADRTGWPAGSIIWTSASPTGARLTSG